MVYNKGLSHAVPGEIKRGSDYKKGHKGKYLMPISKFKKSGPNSVAGVPTALPESLDKFYQDLSSDSDEDDIS